MYILFYVHILHKIDRSRHMLKLDTNARTFMDVGRAVDTALLGDSNNNKIRNAEHIKTMECFVINM